MISIADLLAHSDCCKFPKQDLRFPAASDEGHSLSRPDMRKAPFGAFANVWAATGNRTLIEGSTSLSVNRYTIAAITTHLKYAFKCVHLFIPISILKVERALRSRAFSLTYHARLGILKASELQKECTTSQILLPFLEAQSPLKKLSPQNMSLISR